MRRQTAPRADTRPKVSGAAPAVDKPRSIVYAVGMRALALALGLTVVAACSAAGTLEATPDAGAPPDAGVDAGAAAGRDAGPDAGADAGEGAGEPDAGRDAGPDGGPLEDAGWPGTDAGVFRDGGLTRYPIILAHGFGVFANTEAVTFHGALGALQDAGFRVYPDSTDAFNSTHVCGAELLTTIEQVVADTGAPAVNLIAHSMGGLDARYVASPGGLARGDLVASISTISTPHQGSAMADFTLMWATLGPAVPVLTNIEQAFGIVSLTDPNVIACLTDLSEASAPAFNAATPDDPAVMYQSWAGVATDGAANDPNVAIACQQMELLGPNDVGTVAPLMVPIAAIVGHYTADWPSDSVVAVQSARHGLFRGCVPADHFGEVGATMTGSLADPDPATGFDYAGFYLAIARDLAARGY